MLDTPGQFTREKMRAYKSLEAFNYYIRYAKSFSTMAVVFLLPYTVVGYRDCLFVRLAVTLL